MLSQLSAIGIFVALFAVATLRRVHLGILMFAGACGVGLLLANMPLRTIIGGFPISIMVLLAGVTYFFGIAQVNGTVDVMIQRVLGRIGEQTFLLPIAFFFITTGISAMGSPLGSLVVAPIGMPAARKHGIDPMLMGLAIGTGFSAGGFAPTSLFGMVSYGTAHQGNIDLNPWTLFGVAILANLGILITAFLVFGASRLGRPLGPPAPLALTPIGHDAVIDAPLGRNQIATLVCIGGLVVAVLVLALAGFEPDVGVIAFAFGAVLSLIDPASGKAAVARIDWSTVLLVGGIVTFVGVLQSMGAVAMLGEAASHLGTPILAALVICFVGGLVSAFASTTGILAALVPLALPLAASGQIAGWALVSALAVCASIVDVSPFSTVGATLIASAHDDERARMTSLLTVWGLGLVVIGPAVLVTLLVLPNSF